MEIICPFCPLRCRQLPVRAEADAGMQANMDAGQVEGGLKDYCGLLARRLFTGFEVEDGSPYSETLSAFRGWLSSHPSWRPHFAIEGSFVDVQTARAAIRLAASLDGRIDTVTEHGEDCINEVLEREGFIGATLGEVAERADSLLLLGPVEQRFPRLLHSWSESLGPRRIFRLDESDSVAGKDAVAKRLLDAHASLLHEPTYLNHGQDRNHGQDSEAVGNLTQWLQQAEYLAVMWSSEILNLVTASAMVRLVQLLNRLQRRAVLVPLSEAVTFRTTAAWLTGLGGPLRFRSGLPEIVERSTLTGATASMNPDIRIWLHPFPDSPLPPVDNAKLVVIGAGNRELMERADYYFRTMMPGIEAAGTTFRGDGTVALPLTNWRPSNHPHASRILQELAAIW